MVAREPTQPPIMTELFHQEHGYRDGHQLLIGNLHLSQTDQDTVDRLSDMAGPPRPGELFDPYFTAYPLPSREFYVIARTWQDTQSIRAGCVYTRSLFIPMPYWQHTANLRDLLPHLSSVEGREGYESLYPSSLDTFLPQVHDARLEELVQAVLLRQQQPIVFFETTHAEPICVRLLSVLWPDRKRTFAVCTYALAPRRIEERYFDLVFAPDTARTRFANYPGVSIGRGAPNTSSTLWARKVSAHIFQASQPALVLEDPVGLFSGANQTDESAIRLLLLWHELVAKASHAPTAVLGMLDILNSQSRKGQVDIQNIRPVIIGSIDLAVKQMGTFDALKFLKTLCAKLSNSGVPLSIVRKIIRETNILAFQHPMDALHFLQQDMGTEAETESIVLKGLGDGLGSNKDLGAFFDLFDDLDTDTASTLFALSSDFARSLVFLAKHNTLEWLPILEHLLESSDPKISYKVRRRFIPLLNDRVLSPLLPVVLEALPGDEIAKLIIQIGERTNFDIEEFDQPLWDAVRKAHGQLEVRNAVSARFSHQNANRFLLGTLRFCANDIDWLCSGTLSPNRSRYLLLQLLEVTPDHELSLLERNQETCKSILNHLVASRKRAAFQMARVLLASKLSIDDLLSIGFPILALIDGGVRQELEGVMLERALTEAEIDNHTVDRLLALVGPSVSGADLIRMATASTATEDRVAKNISLLDAAPNEVRNEVLQQVFQLTDKLTARIGGNLGERAYGAWAKMISDASASKYSNTFRTAELALTFALRLPEYPVHSMVRVCFPIVYERLPKTDHMSEVYDAPINPFLLVPLSFLGYSPKPKSRRRSLLRNLVDAFHISSWPPSDLVIIALQSGIERKVLKYLSRKYDGQSYMEEIEADSKRLDKRTRKEVRRAIAEAKLQGPNTK